MIKLTGLWKSKTKDGKPMLSGKLGYNTKLIILPNNYKKKENDPDYNVFLAEYKREVQVDEQQNSVPQQRDLIKQPEQTGYDGVPF